MGEKTGKITPVSLKVQIGRERLRLALKQGERKGKPARMPEIRVGNKDSGIPYRGKDTFSGMWKKYADRTIKGYDPDQPEVTRLFVYDNNKYNADGTLKE